jgi:hypothetical protein
LSWKKAVDEHPPIGNADLKLLLYIEEEEVKTSPHKGKGSSLTDATGVFIRGKLTGFLQSH